MIWVELRDARAWVTRNPLVLSFVLSLLIHSGMYGVYVWGKHLGWWNHQATWLYQWASKKPRSVPVRWTQITPKAQPQAQQQQKPKEIPLTFVQVDPAKAVAEAPENAKHYGVANTKAANPDVRMDSEKPKVDGKQEKLPRLEDVPKPKPFPIQTPPPPQEMSKPAQVASSPKAKAAQKKVEPGDLEKQLLEQLKQPSDGTADATMAAAPKERPRTVAEAKAQKNMLAGERMRQEGGVSRRGEISLDVKLTPFSSYDAAFIAAVEQRWYDLLDHSPFNQRSGKVVLEFRLTSEGKITNMRIVQNEVSEMLALFCQRAVQDPAPYAKWPADMRRIIGSNYRDVTFTFYYY